ncbi:arylmalonate decarboxylase [Roseomonas alkaliterrae]|uniref:Maleate isomerase n=1 Tax=Neoroseomonas alkaliterrae TaxID=1452450 RepID=A0A840Y4X0_9PROT|nr:arylmalonate decarboxylase [Neoroseomonas alkaliterrae]MBB5691407.1 maleate isomerase [Neoroseomonas alkaliterrae]MBR0675543.1 arylmalonate decarboxylase [Neoroseomonas alkaliterrae]
MDAPPLNPHPTLAPRLLMGVVVPATNVTTEAEMDDLRPHGVINATARIANPDAAVASDADAAVVRAAMVAGLMGALDTLAPARPGHVVIGVMVENFVGGGAAGEALLAEAAARIGCPVSAPTQASLAALAALDVRSVALLTPFFPAGDAAAKAFLEEAGIAVPRVLGLRAPGPAAIGRVTAQRLREAVRDLDGPDVQAILQVGTNLPFAAVAREAEAALGKPVLATNPVTYWHALRRAGIAERIPGAGRLFALA